MQEKQLEKEEEVFAPKARMVDAALEWQSPVVRNTTSKDNKQPRVAILFYGLLRTADDTAEYWKEYVMRELDADVFIWTSDTWYPPPEGNIDPLKDKGIIRPENIMRYHDRILTTTHLRSLYGEHLKAAWIYRQNFTEFVSLMEEAGVPYQFPLKDAPEGNTFMTQFSARSYAVLYNLWHATQRLSAYVKDTGSQYDYILYARPDALCFFLFYF